ncbi:MAG: DUF4388 domain-containing protein [Chitinispirillaceae bacterium]|nr:DUF4388 domain-containing protein [Chitinispirillaceae bacterium]
MNKIFYFVLLVACSLFSQPNKVLFVHPSGPRYKKVEMGIKSQLGNAITIVSIVSKNESEIRSAIESNSPKIVIVTSPEIIRVWKRLRQKYTEIGQIPSILFDNDFHDNNTGDMSNSCILTCETKLAQYIERLIFLTGKKPLNVGIISSSKSANVVQSYQKECQKLNVKLYEKQVIASDPENSIKSIIKNFKDHYSVDFIIILNDQAAINNQLVTTIWVSQLSGITVPVAVPAEYFYNSEPRIGLFAIQPHYSAIGAVIASVINRAAADNWWISQKSIYTDKSIVYFRNSDGSVSKQNHTQNDIIATYHPERKDSHIQAVAQTEQPAVPQQQFSSGDLALAEIEDAGKEDLQKKKDSEKVINSVPTEKTTARVTKTATKSETKRVAASAPVKVEEKKVKTPPAEVKKEVPRHITQSAAVALNRSIEEPSNEITASTYGADTIFDLQQKSRSDFFLSRNILLVAIAVSLIAAVLLIYVLLRSRKMYRDVGKNNCLLIKKRKKLIRFSEVDNSTITISKYLKDYGFNIIKSAKLSEVSDLLLFNLPEIICIDWQLDPDIQKEVYKILKEQMFSAEFILIFYNVAESSEIKMGYYEDRTFFLNENFTIAELNKILSIVKERSKTQKQISNKSNSQFEGKIVENTLSEIFQMMDVNKKTGCLIVETDHPAGMVFFEDGMITYSITNSQVAEAAVFEILEMKNGRFHFLHGKKPLSRQMQASVVALLMEQATFLDEFKKPEFE